MVLIKYGLLKAFIWTLRVSDAFLLPIPIRWKQNEFQFVCKGISELKILKFRLYALLLYFMLAVFQVHWFWDTSSRVVNGHGVMNCIGYIMGFTCCYLNCTKTEQIVNLLNNVIAFETRNYEMDSQAADLLEKSPKTWIRKIMIKVQICTAYLPITYHLGVLAKPCYPMVVGFWTLAQCSNATVDFTNSWEITKLVLVTLWSFSSFALLLPGIVPQTLMILLLGHGFAEYIAQYER